ncbi:MAG: hypothetical protein RR898_09545 [Clostridium sp.]|uniref:hypothetical protein n=1 Tax=Clostridium sp. TaxID=1506 RepID=UPI002FC6E282
MFIDGKVYADKYNRLYYCEKGELITSTGFRYDAKDKSDFKLTRFTKEQMINLISEKKKFRYKYR